VLVEALGSGEDRDVCGERIRRFMERKVKTSEGYLRVRQQFVSLHIGSALSPQTENIHLVFHSFKSKKSN
jgi:hypothetical protein